MDQVHRYFGAHRIWSHKNLHMSSLDVFDIWYCNSTDKLLVEKSSLCPEDISKWLSESLPKLDSSGNTYVRRFRLVILHRQSKQNDQILCENTLGQILSHFELQVAYSYAMSCTSGIVVFPPQLYFHREVRTYGLIYHPKLAAVWSVSRDTTQRTIPANSPGSSPVLTTKSCPMPYSVNALIVAGPEESIMFNKLLSNEWDAGLALHAMFPAFLCGILMTEQVGEQQERLKVGLRETEVRTGHHFFANRHEQPAVGDLAHLSATMSGFAAKLASARRKIHLGRQLQNLIREYAQGGASFSEILY